MKLYESGPSRSARCRWTLLELGLEFESIEARELIGTDEYKKVHPQGKLPALVLDDGKVLFESAAICTYLADLAPEKKLLAPPGSWGRALHGQWVSFTLSELEAYLWSNARHTWFLPEDERVAAIVEPNNREAYSALAVLDRALAEDDYLVDNTFSVTDIFVGYAINWARRAKVLEGFDNLEGYLGRLLAREHCPLPTD